MEEKKYLSIVSACEEDLEKYGDTFMGVGWTKKQEFADTRYRVMMDLVKHDGTDTVTVLDFGCGTSHLYEHIQRQKLDHIAYSGLDLSEKYLSVAKRKFPHITYYHLDIMDDHVDLPEFDYIVLNGMFNYKGKLSFEEMLSYFQAVVRKVFPKARKGIAFNVMSKQVDWERDDLFHLPFDLLASFVTANISRNFVIRHDYGLYEYTTYVYR